MKLIFVGPLIAAFLLSSCNLGRVWRGSDGGSAPGPIRSCPVGWMRDHLGVCRCPTPPCR